LTPEIAQRRRVSACPTPALISARWAGAAKKNPGAGMNAGIVTTPATPVRSAVCREFDT
jgi:hypothetical protein